MLKVRFYHKRQKLNSLSTAILHITLVLIGCDFSSQQSLVEAPRAVRDIDFSALSTVEEQAIFFETQIMIALDQLGLADYGLPRIDSQGDNDAEFTWNNPHGYLSDVPVAFKDGLARLVDEVSRQESHLKEVFEVAVVEHSHLVTEEDVDQVTDDLLAMIVVQGTFPTGISDWVASIVVKLDTWEIKSYTINQRVKEKLRQEQPPGDRDTGHIDYMSYIPALAWVPDAFSTRRVISQGLYDELTARQPLLSPQELSTFSPGVLPVVGITGNGQVETVGLETGITSLMLDACEACDFFCSFKEKLR